MGAGTRRFGARILENRRDDILRFSGKSMEGDRCDALYEKGDTIDEPIAKEGNDGFTRFEGKRNDSVTF